MQPARSCINAVSSRSSNKFTPPSFSGFTCVGWVKSAHGIRGEIYIQLYAKQADWLDSAEEISLIEAGRLRAWTIEGARPHKEGLILKLKGVDDRNFSETLRKAGAYIPDALLVSDE